MYIKSSCANRCCFATQLGIVSIAVGLIWFVAGPYLCLLNVVGLFVMMTVIIPVLLVANVLPVINAAMASYIVYGVIAFGIFFLYGMIASYQPTPKLRWKRAVLLLLMQFLCCMDIRDCRDDLWAVMTILAGKGDG